MKNSPDTIEKNDHRFKIYGVEFFYLGFLGVFTALIGWIAENVAKSFLSGFIDSRFHILPFISPYALIVFAVHMALGSPDDLTVFGRKIFKENTRKNKIYSNILSFFIICLFVFLGELVVGNLWEALFDIRLWNYSKHPLHITKFTSPLSVFGFGTGTYLLFKFVYTPALSLVRRRVNYNFAKWFVIILGSLMILDTVRLIICMAVLGEAPIYWRIYL